MKRGGPLKRKTWMRKVRKEPRKAEPTPAEKLIARQHCFERAQGRCELRISAECRGDRTTGFKGGHLHHEHAKRRFGWMESETQRHIWCCPACHALTHAGIKPVPKGEWRDTM